MDITVDRPEAPTAIHTNLCAIFISLELSLSSWVNDIDPQAWLADVLARMPGIPVSRLPELLPWNWSAACTTRQRAA